MRVNTLYGSVTLSTDDEELIRQLRAALRAVAESFVGHVAHDLVSQICLEEFVTCAHRRQLRTNAERATQTRIGWLTGISPEAVRGVLNRNSCSIASPLTVEERVLCLWQNNPEYLLPGSNTPSDLLFLGGRETFQGLVSRVARGITPQLALQTLVARGRVELFDTHWVRLIRPSARVQSCVGGSRFARPRAPAKSAVSDERVPTEVDQ